MLDLINPYTLKIMISCRKQDSIRAISQRIKVSYGWTYKWIRELAQQGMVRLTRMKVYLNQQNEFYQKSIQYIKTIGAKASFYYEVLPLLGIRYCFTKTDAVYIWTKGGYNIARYQEYYPIFIKIDKKDQDIFEWYCSKLKLPIDKDKGIFYKVQYVDTIHAQDCEGYFVEPLETTIQFMRQYIYNFMPAVEMINEMYGKKIPIQYKEAITNV